MLNQPYDYIIAQNAKKVKNSYAYFSVLGDVFDRGSRPDLIIDSLMKHHSLDIQWGNHDTIWMAAAAGSERSGGQNRCQYDAKSLCRRAGRFDAHGGVLGVSPINTVSHSEKADLSDRRKPRACQQAAADLILFFDSYYLFESTSQAFFRFDWCFCFSGLFCRGYSATRLPWVSAIYI